MNSIKVIITGATGMVGEGVLFECLQNPQVSEVLIIGRRHYEIEHPKLKELIVPDFFQLNQFAENIKGYDACFFCAGVTSVGKNEEKYRFLTYNTTLAFAKAVAELNTNMVFIYVSGASTDSHEKSKMMWARVKGKTENDLMKLPFKAEYNFRPGIMLPFDGQKNWKVSYKILARIIKPFFPKSVLSMKEVGKAMINGAIFGYPRQVLEVSDIRELALHR